MEPYAASHLARASSLPSLRGCPVCRLTARERTAPGFPAQACTGERDASNPATLPAGLYFTSNIPVGDLGLVKYVDVKFDVPGQDFDGEVTYTLDLKGCAFVPPALSKCVDFFGTKTKTFKQGYFRGNQLIPVGGPGVDVSIFDRGIDQLLNIEWCPDQNQFMVKVMMSPPYTLVHKPKVSDEL